MSIRLKFVLIMLIAFSLNIGALVGFYNFFLSDTIKVQLHQLQDELEEKLDSVIEAIETQELEPSILSISTTSKFTYVMTIQDESGQVIYTNDTNALPLLGVYANRMIQKNGQLYLINLTAALSVNNAAMIPPVQLILRFEYLMIIIISLILSIVIYSFIVKPIESLEEDIKNYQKGIYPKKIRRGDEIGRLHNRFFSLVEDLEQQKAQQNRMISSISHDIKTPLTSIMGYSERLKNGGGSQERLTRYIETIYEKSLVIKELVDEFDDYLNDRLMTTLDCKPILVSQFMECLKSDYQEELKDLGIEFIMTCVGKDVQLNLDISKVRRVFGNIIDNSVKQLSEQQSKKIQIESIITEKNVLFQISDNGPGVRESDMEKIFEPFYTSDPSRKVAGLGLSICRNIVQAHASEIWAEPCIDGGLSIIIRFKR